MNNDMKYKTRNLKGQFQYRTKDEIIDAYIDKYQNMECSDVVDQRIIEAWLRLIDTYSRDKLFDHIMYVCVPKF